MGVYRSNGAVDHRETAPGAGSYLAGGKRAAHSELQRGGEAGGPARRLLRYSASSAGQHGDLRGGFCGSVPYFLLRVSMVIAATDRPGTRCAARGLLIGKNAAATDRPAAQLLLFTTDSPRRHRPPRSATTAPQRARLADWQPPPQTAPQRNYFFLPQTAPAATDHRPPHNARAKTPPPQTAPERAARRAAC